MKKSSLLLCSLLVSLFFVVACNHSKGGGNNNKDPDPTPSLKPEGVTTDEALTIIQENKGNKDFVIFDVRTKAEFKEGYLKGHLEESEDAPYGGVMQHDRYDENYDQFLSTLDKTKRYLIHCRTDVRSKYTFEELKKKGFKKIQYIIGGYTKWANEGKPIEHPDYEKAVDVLITGDKIKTNSTIKFNFLVTDLDGDPLRKAVLSLQVFLGTNEIEKKDDLKTDNTGKAEYTFDATSKTKGAYRLICTVTHKTVHENFKSVEGHYYFEVAEQDEVVGGSASEITPEDDITTDIANKFYNRNVYGYKVYDRERNVVSLAKPVDVSKPTMVILFSPTCLGCMVKAKELDKYNLDNINFIPVLTSIDEEDLENEISHNEELLKKNELSSMVPHALYDAKDKIWLSRFKFKTTPKFILINKEGQIKDIIHGGENVKTADILKKMVNMFGVPEFKFK